MQVLVGWDDAPEAELIALYLDVEDNRVTVTTRADELLRHASERRDFDVVLYSTNLGNDLDSLDVCRRISESLPDVPIVGACRHEDVFRVAQFLRNGLRHYLVRDRARDFLYLLHVTLKNAVDMARAEREQRVAAKLRTEIDSVRKLQEAIIPRRVRCTGGYHVCARYETSQIQVLGGRPVVMAGGDYYDVFRLDQHTWAVLVADASGHGVRACLSMMVMHTLVRMLHDLRHGDAPDANQSLPGLFRADLSRRDPAAVVSEVNRHLCGQSVIADGGGFITLLYGLLCIDSHEFRWCSAGHPAPLLQQPGSQTVGQAAALDSGNLPVGIDEFERFESHSVSLPPGSRLMLYTDGLTEAFTDIADAHREFSLAGVTQTLVECAALPLEDVLTELFSRSNAFTAGAGRHDDTSVVLIERSSND